jgi:hypothetical protein
MPLGWRVAGTLPPAYVLMGLGFPPRHSGPKYTLEGVCAPKGMNLAYPDLAHRQHDALNDEIASRGPCIGELENYKLREKK